MSHKLMSSKSLIIFIILLFAIAIILLLLYLDSLEVHFAKNIEELDNPLTENILQTFSIFSTTLLSALSLLFLIKLDREQKSINSRNLAQEALSYADNILRPKVYDVISNLKTLEFNRLDGEKYFIKHSILPSGISPEKKNDEYILKWIVLNFDQLIYLCGELLKAHSTLEDLLEVSEINSERNKFFLGQILYQTPLDYVARNLIDISKRTTSSDNSGFQSISKDKYIFFQWFNSDVHLIECSYNEYFKSFSKGSLTWNEELKNYVYQKNRKFDEPRLK